ncbi:MAG TPA: SDR family oxidoreductase [Tepidisphaeraceae bacterium]|nr:SDR family oxidoreductase [Tepidisphaeraceae bacterium]
MADSSSSGARIALVTGGAKRVGRAIVERLAAEGFDVAFTYNTSGGEADALAGQLRQRGRRAVAIRADLFDPAAGVAAIFNEFSRHFPGGRLDVLVNSASAYLPARLRETDLELIRRLNAIHLEAPLLLCQRFEPLLRAARGHVVNMVDLLAERPWPQYLAYAASKAALVALTVGLARELAPECTANGIAPGVVEWPPDYPEAEREKYLKRVPLGRAGTPQDVANLVHFLATGGAYINGQIIRLDGGRSVT